MKHTLALFWMLIASAGPAMPQDNLEIHYYAKEADDDSILDAILSFKGLPTPIKLRSNQYYDKNGLPSNALMCGSKADPELVLQLLDHFFNNGIEIQYFGNYYDPEINSEKNVIDIRSYGDVEFFKSRKALTSNDIPTDIESFCGFGSGISVSKKVADSPSIAFIIDGIDNKENAEMIAKIYRTQGRVVEYERDGGLQNGTYRLLIRNVTTPENGGMEGEELQ